MTPQSLYIFRFVVIPLFFLMIYSTPINSDAAFVHQRRWWGWILEDSITVMEVLLASEGTQYIYRLLERRYSWERSMIGRFSIQIILQGLWCAANIWGGQMLSEWMYDRNTPNNILVLQFTRSLALALFVATTYTLLLMFQRSQRLLLEAEELKRANAVAQVEALKQQLDPHFLFNSLNTLTMLVLKDQRVAVQFIKRLSEIYRYVLSSKDTNLVRLEEEIAFVRDYLFLSELRFGENLHVSITLPTQWKEFLVPPMTVQLLLENAMKHNIISAEHPLTVSIAVEDSWLIVRNSVQMKQRNDYEGEPTKVGLKNIIQRYQFVAHKSPVIEQIDTDFIVKVPLLLHNVLD